MTRRTLAIALVAFSSALLFEAPVEAAHGSSSWRVSADFRVGGIHFSLGYMEPSRYGGYFYAPRHYYRVRKPIHYSGYRCGSACYTRDKHFFHHPTCPVVNFHFQRHGFWPGDVLWNSGYGGYGGYGSYDGYRGQGYYYQPYSQGPPRYYCPKHKRYEYRGYQPRYDDLREHD